MSHPTTIITVVAESLPASIAAQIISLIRQGKPLAVQAIGSMAVEQAMKAAALAWCYLEAEGIAVACFPSFAKVKIDNRERTFVRLEVRTQPHK